jgi:hypothetical protein
LEERRIEIPKAGTEDRKLLGEVAVTFTVGAMRFDELIRLGWRDENRRGDGKAVAAAIIGMAQRGLA